MFWCERSFARVVGSGLQTVWAAFQSSVLSAWGHFDQSPQHKASNNFITTYIRAKPRSWPHLWGTWKPPVSRCAAAPLIRLTYRRWQPLFYFFFPPPVFVSLPVFIKLVKFLLQRCQPCIMLRCSHHGALQLPGNQVWRRHVKRQRTPSDEERTSNRVIYIYINI